MKFKKCLSWRKGYLRYSFESEPSVLSNAVIYACEILSKGLLIIEVFSKDPITGILKANTQFICQNGCFSYYLCEQIEFFRRIDFASARYISIYSVLEFDREKASSKYLNNSFTFHICFGNSLETSHIMICRKHYTGDTGDKGTVLLSPPPNPKIDPK